MTDNIPKLSADHFRHLEVRVTVGLWGNGTPVWEHYRNMDVPLTLIDSRLVTEVWGRALDAFLQCVGGLTKSLIEYLK